MHITLSFALHYVSLSQYNIKLLFVLKSRIFVSNGCLMGVDQIRTDDIYIYDPFETGYREAIITMSIL